MSNKQLKSTKHKEEVPSVAQPEQRQIRDQLPTDIPTDLLSKVHSQLCRIKVLQIIQSKLPIDASQISSQEIELFIGQVAEVHKTFTEVHSHLEVTWPGAHRQHSYFKDDVFATESARVFTLLRALSKLKAQLAPQTIRLKLPEITVPVFNGEYTEWLIFRDMFTSLIIENSELSDIERLHYLRSSVRGEPARLINNLPLIGKSFSPSWQTLTTRYSYKRLLINIQLDKLSNLTPATAKNATSLNALSATVSGVTSTLNYLGVTELGEHMLVHCLVRNFDCPTREARENSIASTTEYPTLTQVRAFIATRVRALESMDSVPASKVQI